MSADPVADERRRALEALARGVPAHRRMLVRVCLVDVSGRALVARRSMDDEWLPGQWQLPCGSVKEAEAPLEAARREVLEEVGIELAPERLLACGTASFLLHRPDRGVVEDWGNVNFRAALDPGTTPVLGPELSAYALLARTEAARRLPEQADRDALEQAFTLGERVRRLLGT